MASHTTTAAGLARASVRWQRAARGYVVTSITLLYAAGFGLLLAPPLLAGGLAGAAVVAGICGYLADRRADALHRQSLKTFLFDAVDEISADLLDPPGLRLTIEDTPYGIEHPEPR